MNIPKPSPPTTKGDAPVGANSQAENPGEIVDDKVIVFIVGKAFKSTSENLAMQPLNNHRMLKQP